MKVLHKTAARLWVFYLVLLFSRSAQLFMHSYLHGNKHTYLDTLIMET